MIGENGEAATADLGVGKGKMKITTKMGSDLSGGVGGANLAVHG